MKWFLGVAFLTVSVFSIYQNTVIRSTGKTLIAFEQAVYKTAEAHQSASARSNKWEQRYYSCIKLQVVSAP